MSNDTHPNAYRAEADEERKLAAQHAERANELAAKADELEKTDTSTTIETDGTQPYGGEKQTEETEQPKSKLFNKK